MKILRALLPVLVLFVPLAVHADPGPRLKCPHHVDAAADGTFSVQCEVTTNATGPVTLFLSVIPCTGQTFASLGLDRNQVQPTKGNPDGFHVQGQLQADPSGAFHTTCFTVILRDAAGNELDRYNVSVRAP